MRFELNEIEARSEHYPSTISFLNLLNTLIAEERDVSDRGRRYSLINNLFVVLFLFHCQIFPLVTWHKFFSRFICIFRFIYDHVFGPFPQRAYADLQEKWQLVIACLKHIQMCVLLLILVKCFKNLQ